MRSCLSIAGHKVSGQLVDAAVVLFVFKCFVE